MSQNDKTDCDKDMTLEECEMAILHAAVDKTQEITGKEITSSPEIKRIILIVENFLKNKNVICYGGTAINAILPEKDKFYKDSDLPDFDFFSPKAMLDAKELCDLYANKGFAEIEGKSGMHEGTYKVFVNFVQVADVTQINPEIFKALKKDSIRVNDIMYAPPNFLRMAMYIELSRPKGDTSRWEKVLKRLNLLNKNFPLKANNCDKFNLVKKGNKIIPNEARIFELVTIADFFLFMGANLFPIWLTGSIWKINSKHD
jgi:hypothetical protein